MEEVRLISGVNRSCIYDLPRRDYHFVPNEIKGLIEKIEKQPIAVFDSLTEDEKEWVSEMEQQEWIAKVPAPTVEFFSKLNLEWESPSIITNAILEDGEHLGKSLKLVDELICKFIVIQCSDLKRLENILKQHFKVSNFQNIDVILEGGSLDQLEDLREQYPILGNVYTTENSEQEDVFQLVNSEERKPALTVNIDAFTEAQEHHLYYNRKLFISSGGEIKNAPESTQVFGNINELKGSGQLLAIVLTEEFKRNWYVSKEKCTVCKDCEFRMMCVDTREPKQNAEGEWYHEEECCYNPYISKWKGEEGYADLSSCGVEVLKGSQTINHQQLELINEELWS